MAQKKLSLQQNRSLLETNVRFFLQQLQLKELWHTGICMSVKKISNIFESRVTVSLLSLS